MYPFTPALVAAALAALATLGGCVEGRTPGDELFGTWAEVGAEGEPTGWTFRDDLTFERTGPAPATGIFWVDGQRLTIEESPSPQGADRLAFEYVATRDHWLASALFADGTVIGRIGVWRGEWHDLVEDLRVETTLDVRAGGAVHERRHLVGAGRDEVCEGDGTWEDAPTGSGFVVTVTLTCPTQSFTESRRLWRLGDAVGGPLFERVSF